MSRIIKELEQIIARRKKQRDSRLYTCRLLTEGTLVERKVNEEAYELIEAAFTGKRGAILSEATDLLFHFLVLLGKYDISFSDLENEFIKRRSDADY